MKASGLPLLAASLASSPWPRAVRAVVSCNETHNPCADLLWAGSECIKGSCTNPFQSGCLRALLDSPEYEEKFGEAATEKLQALRRRVLSKPRVCNSEDTESDVDVDEGACTPNENDYPEVRIYAQNWEGSIVFSWILQIIYSELLGVPSTIESGAKDEITNFYDVSNRMDYGTGNDVSGIQNAFDAKGDCSVYKEGNDNGEEYMPCAHIAMDLWHAGTWDPVVDSGAAEAAKMTGVIGVDGWHVTKSALEKDPSLSSYYGLKGEDNRRKLAETFKRPTTWKDYCEHVSVSRCSEADGVAARPPAEDGSEDNKYFLKGSYTGYFKATEKNDCSANPNCTGHFLDYPCGWTSFFKQQAYHLKIALESDGPEASGGYSYGDMVDIWMASNATESSIIGIWWSPEALISLFAGSDSELIKVGLPTPTQECLDNRIDINKRCEPDATAEEIYGSSKGSCARENINELMIATSDLQSSILTHKNPKGRLSPAYDVYAEFATSTEEVNHILSNWVSRGVDKYGFDLRFATCGWVADNLEEIMNSMIPPSHPQTLVLTKQMALTVVAGIFAAFATTTVLSTTGGIMHRYKKKSLAKSAQIEFLLLILAGLLMVSISAMTLALEPSIAMCTISMWMINVGYTTQLIPTLIRVATINKIIRESKKMRIVKVDKKKLIQKSIGLSSLAAVFCLFWTIFDTPKPQSSLEVTSDQNDFGETIVRVSHFCGSESSIWFYTAYSIQSILLIIASALAYQMRTAPNSVNDSKQLAYMIYTSFFFLALRLMISVVSESVKGESASLKASLQKTSSIFISLDTMANILIFFSGYFLKDKPKETTAGHGARHFLDNIARRRDSTCSSNIETVDLARGSTQTNNVQSSLALPNELDCSEGPLKKESPVELENGKLLTIRFKTEDGGKSIRFPKWVVDEYGSEEYNHGTFDGVSDETSRDRNDETLQEGKCDNLMGGANDTLKDDTLTGGSDDSLKDDNKESITN